MAIGDAFTEDALAPYEWAHFGHLWKLPFRLVVHELEGLVRRVLDVMDAFAANMVGQSVPSSLAQHFRELVLATCARQREHVRQIARFKRSDFE